MSIRLATNRFCGKSSHEAFLEVQKKCFFTNKLLANQSYITPYVVVTDGKNVIVQENSNSMDIGLPFEVQKIHSGIHRYKDNVEDSIINNLWKMWHNIKIMEEVPSDVQYDTKLQKISKIGVGYRNLERSDIRLHCTEKGFYGYNKKHYHPVYFLMIPGDSTINFTPKKSLTYQSAKLSQIVLMSKELSLSYASTNVIQLLKSAEIMIPNISNPTEE